MTKARGLSRISRGLVDMSETEDAEEFLAQFPPEELLEERVDLDLDETNRCIQKFLIYKGRVVWFSIVQQTRHEGEWETVIRADTCHSEAHIHVFKRGKREELQRRSLVNLSTIEEVEQGFDLACDRITETWEENVRRWKER